MSLRLIALDLKILAMTVGTVFSAEGVSAPSYVSAPEFKGGTTENSAT